MNGFSPEIWYLSDPAQGLCIPEGNTVSSVIGELESETRGRRPIRVTHDVNWGTSENPGVLDRSVTTNDHRSSMSSKWNKRQRQMTLRESDDRVVPKKPEDQSGESKSGNTDAGKAVRISRDSDAPPLAPSGETTVQDRLDRITERAKTHPEEVFNNLFSLLNYELLWYAFRRLKRGKSPGIDGVTLEDYEENLRDNLLDLLDRLHRGAYRPKPSLRKNIPKGNGKTRPLGIASVEDKLVQRSIVMILEQIYEVDFYDFSYGYRPKRSCHEALSVLGEIISTRKVNWISDADIKGFFDNVSHEHLIELLRKRISDPKMLRLIDRFLKAGVMIDGRLEATEDGVPQGASLSPMLANVYLHYVLDEWFECEVKPRLRGDAFLIRFADDFICSFQYEDDARRYQAVLPKRLGRFCLQVAEEKTSLIAFGRFARRNHQRRGEGAPGPFDFLGFTHYCGRARSGRFKLKRKTSGKKFRQKLTEMRLWFHHQLSTPIGDMWQALNAKLRGHYQYYGINDNWPMLMVFRSKVRRMAKRHLSRRSQNSYVNWDHFRRLEDLHPLVGPRRLTDLIAMRRQGGAVDK